jgi:enterochelin esterase-like enzyme
MRAAAFGLAALTILAGCGSTTAPSAATFATGNATASPSDFAPTLAPTLAPGACTARGGAAAGYKPFDCSVPAPALEGNLLGDAALLRVVVLLPDGYETSSRSYASIYLLAGYGADAGSLGDVIAEGFSIADLPETEPAILVVVDGMNAFGGSFYVDSTVTGNWDGAISGDLVGWVDGNYRTAAQAASRGIAGHSMGGFGAFGIAMRHPDVFGAVYALSGDFVDEDGLTAWLGDPTAEGEVLDALDSLAALSPEQATAQLPEIASSSYEVEQAFAAGSAFAPDPDARSLMRYPFRREGAAIVRDEGVWRTWRAGLADWPARVDRYGAGLAQLRAIGLDYGTTDEYPWIPAGNRALAELLRGAGISVTEATFEGGHANQLSERVALYMLPFFSANLVQPEP